MVDGDYPEADASGDEEHGFGADEEHDDSGDIEYGSR